MECGKVGSQFTLTLRVQSRRSLVALDPSVFQQLGNRRPVPWVFLNALLDEFAKLCGVVIAEKHKRAIIVHDAVMDAFLCGVATPVEEGRLTRHQDECDDTDGPHIDFVVVLDLLHQLGRHVKRTTEGQVLHLVWLKPRGESKIGQFDRKVIAVAVSVLLNQNVLRLQVTVHDVLQVHAVECEEQLVDDVSYLCLRKTATFRCHFLEKVATCDNLHDDIVVPFVFHELKDTSDVGVFGGLEHLKLVLVQVDVDVVHQGLLLDDLDRTRGVRLPMLSEFDTAEGPRSDLFGDLVVLGEAIHGLETTPILEAHEVCGLLALLGGCQSALLLHHWLNAKEADGTSTVNGSFRSLFLVLLVLCWLV